MSLGLSLSHASTDRDAPALKSDRISVGQRLMYVLIPYTSIELIVDQEDDSRDSNEQRVLGNPKFEHRELNHPRQYSYARNCVKLQLSGIRDTLAAATGSPGQMRVGQ